MIGDEDGLDNDNNIVLVYDLLKYMLGGSSANGSFYYPYRPTTPTNR